MGSEKGFCPMLLSMTGFGRGEFSQGNIQAVAEIRSVNNRFLDVVARLPKAVSGYEQDVKEMVRRHIGRGRINVAVTLQSPALEGLGIRVDFAAARAYTKMLREMTEQLRLDGGVRLEHLLTFPEIFTVPEEEELTETIWNCVQRAIVQALENMQEMRAREGENLARDMLERIDKLERYIGQIEALSREHIPEQFERLKHRLEELMRSPEIDRSRLEMELAVLADRQDVTEECVRFRSHIQLFREMVQDEKTAGRKLNFLLQEMNREANTIASKANHSEIAHFVVFIKEEIERLREQVQNIE